jgi:glycosyltransferase involved in cell wall biosynthesis
VDYLGVRGAIRAFAPDFLYKRHARFDVGALLAARHAGIPSVLEVNCLFSGRHYHQYEPMTFGAVAASLERRALTIAGAVVAVSTPLAREIGAAAPVHADVVPNGADPDRFNVGAATPGIIRARYGLGKGLIVGWAGVLREWHGLQLLLDSLVRVPDVRLLLVGDGPARSSIEHRAADLGLGHRVVITGRVPHAEMPDHLAAMDIAVVARDGTGVASPMKLVEYMAMARPVVAPNLENIRDLVTHEVDGLLFADRDSAELVGALHRLAIDDDLRRRLGNNARRTVERERNWRRNAERILAIAESLAAEHALGAARVH